MANPFVAQSKTNEGVTQPTQQNGITTQFNSPTVRGNAIVAFYTVSDFAGVHTDLSATDTQTNAFTLQNQQNSNQAGGSQTVALLTATGIAGDTGAADTVSTFLSINGDVEDFQAAFLVEVGGVGALGVVGQSGNTQNALANGSNNAVSGNITLTAAQVPALMVAICTNSSGGTVPTVGTGMTLLTNCWGFGGASGSTVATRLITTAGTYQAIFNQANGAATDITVNAVVFQGSIPGGPGAGLATATGALTVATLFAAAGTAKATAQAAITVVTGFVGKAVATAVALGALATPSLPPGLASGVASASGSLTTGILQTGSGGAVASASGALTTSTPTGLSFGASSSAHALSNALSVSTIGVTTQNNSGFVVGLIDRGGTAGTVADNMGNTYLPLGSPRTYSFGSATMTFWYCAKGTGGVGHSVTGTHGYFADMSVYFQEIKNTSGAGMVLDQLVQDYDTASPYTTSGLTTTQAQEALVCMFGGFSTSNPATLAVSGGSLVIKASQTDGGSLTEAVGGLAGAVVSTIQSGLAASFTQVGNPFDAATIFASFAAAPVPGSFIGPAAGVASATGTLSTAAALFSAAAGKATAAAALTNWATVVLVSANAYTGIGSIYDPYFWLDAVPQFGNTVFYDATFLTIQPTGEIVSTANNINAVVQFNNGSGMAQGLVQLTSGEAAYAYGLASATGNFTTRPSVFAGPAAGVTTAGGALTTGFALAGPAPALASAAGDLTVVIQLAGAATGVASSPTSFLGSAAQLAGAAAATAQALGALQIKQVLAGGAYGDTIARGDLTHGMVCVGLASGVATGSGVLLTAKRMVSLGAGLASATGALTTGVRLTATPSAATATGSGALSAAARLGGAAAGLATTLGNLRIGSAFRAPGAGLATAAGVMTTGGGQKGAARSLVTATGTIVARAQLAGAAFAIATGDPILTNLTTNQSPVGMYRGDPNFMIGDRYYNKTPVFDTIGPSEIRVLTFDFAAANSPTGNGLLAGETLISVAQVTVTNSAGNDPTPADIINGLASFDPTQTQVMVPVNSGLGLVANDYYIMVRCPTSNPNKVLERFGLLQIRG